MERLSLDDYDFELPERLIAQNPSPRRTGSRLLVWSADGDWSHLRFDEVGSRLRPGDLLVLNDTRVFPARLHGRKVEGRVGVEVLLVGPADEGSGWEAMVRPGRRLRPGTRVRLDGGAELQVGESLADGLRRVVFEPGLEILAYCREHGHVPLPPYIRRPDAEADRERYQTVFARREGSVAAPTAGLHFDEALLDRLDRAGIRRASVTLHVGPGTFRPVEDAQLRTGELHPESFTVPTETIRAIDRTRAGGGRVVVVGTTVCRALESLPADAVAEVSGRTRLLISPGFRFRHTDVLLTNFHLPRSSLLLLVAAFAPDRWTEAYRLAIEEGYRFYSYGDANWIEARP